LALRPNIKISVVTVTEFGVEHRRLMDSLPSVDRSLGIMAGSYVAVAAIEASLG